MSFKSARKEALISVSAAARALGVTNATIYMWEGGDTHPEFDKIPKIAKLYHCSIDKLFEQDGGETTEESEN